MSSRWSFWGRFISICIVFSNRLSSLLFVIIILSKYSSKDEQENCHQSSVHGGQFGCKLKIEQGALEGSKQSMIYCLSFIVARFSSEQRRVDAGDTKQQASVEPLLLKVLCRNQSSRANRKFTCHLLLIITPKRTLHFIFGRIFTVSSSELLKKSGGFSKPTTFWKTEVIAVFLAKFF